MERIYSFIISTNISRVPTMFQALPALRIQHGRNRCNTQPPELISRSSSKTHKCAMCHKGTRNRQSCPSQYRTLEEYNLARPKGTPGWEMGRVESPGGES